MSGQKPAIVLVASPHAREGETSRFLRFVREHANVLKQYSIHCTGGTALSLTGTGMYSAVEADDEVHPHREGSRGGLVEVAAMVARSECSAVLLLIDARDPHHDDIQIQILKRVANKRGVRLIITYADAIRWALFEAKGASEDRDRATTPSWRPRNWLDGVPNDRTPLTIGQRTLALTANDGSKAQIIAFVSEHVATLRKHRRILATGTTGWLLKLLYADDNQTGEFLEEALAGQPLHYFAPLLGALDVVLKHDGDFPSALDTLRHHFRIVEDPPLARMIIPLLAGPEGGDVLLALEVLENRCDTVISLHEPAESRPFGGGGRMLEQTCQLPGVYTACLDNRRSAEDWARGLRHELSSITRPVTSYQSLRERFGLREIVGVDFADEPYSDDEGRALHRAAAGYLHAAVTRLIDSGGGRIVVSWGWVMRGVVDELRDMGANGVIEKPASPSSSLVWSPAVGVVAAHPALGAESIASDLRDFYGGTVDAFTRPAFVFEGGLAEPDQRLMDRLRDADIVLTSAAPWDDSAGLLSRSGLSPGLFPDIDDPRVVGTIGGVFVAADGSEVASEKSSVLVGLDYVGLQCAVRTGALILIGGGASRRAVIQAALAGRLVSVLITSAATVDWLANRSAATEAAAATTPPDSAEMPLHVFLDSDDPVRVESFLVALRDALAEFDFVEVGAPSDPVWGSYWQIFRLPQSKRAGFKAMADAVAAVYAGVPQSLASLQTSEAVAKLVAQAADPALPNIVLQADNHILVKRTLDNGVPILVVKELTPEQRAWVVENPDWMYELETILVRLGIGDPPAAATPVHGPPAA